LPKVRWVLSYGFCSKFHTAVQTLQKWLRFDKVTENLKVGTFLRHSVYTLNRELIAKHTITLDWSI